ncbi:MAG: hypothetical protein CL459_01560 [Acidimicrobiaceae bacterium]|nr:hypothetical protein [Acidimicrobiaceae bacterium]
MNEQLALTPPPTRRRTESPDHRLDGPVRPTRPRYRLDARTRAIGLAGVRAARARLRQIAEAEAEAEGRPGPASTESSSATSSSTASSSTASSSTASSSPTTEGEDDPAEAAGPADTPDPGTCRRVA